MITHINFAAIAVNSLRIFVCMFINLCAAFNGKKPSLSFNHWNVLLLKATYFKAK